MSVVFAAVVRVGRRSAATMIVIGYTSKWVVRGVGICVRVGIVVGAVAIVWGSVAGTMTVSMPAEKDVAWV